MPTFWSLLKYWSLTRSYLCHCNQPNLFDVDRQRNWADHTKPVCPLSFRLLVNHSSKISAEKCRNDRLEFLLFDKLGVRKNHFQDYLSLPPFEAFCCRPSCLGELTYAHASQSRRYWKSGPQTWEHHPVLSFDGIRLENNGPQHRDLCDRLYQRRMRCRQSRTDSHHSGSSPHSSQCSRV